MRYVAHHEWSEWVTLSDREINGAAMIGSDLRAASLADGRVEKQHGQDDGRYIHIVGAIAERAAAKALMIYWPGAFNNGKDADLPFNIEVRQISADHYGCRVRDDDDDSRRVVAVIIQRGHERESYRIPGWIEAARAKRAEWRIAPHGRPPFYAVPQSELWPLDELRLVIAREMVPDSAVIPWPA